MTHKHNRDNPRCPDCKSISHKLGFVPRKTGKVQRFQCVECGRCFLETTVNVRIADIPQHLSEVA